jgi:DNA-binding HxlR family transcriptional regulator
MAARQPPTLLWRIAGFVARSYADAMEAQPGHHASASSATERFSTPESAAKGVEEVLGILEGRWKLSILFQLFGGKVRRFSELERAIPAVSQKVLTQQLRHLERDGIVRRMVYAEVPPRVEYALTEWGQALCPVLDALLKWSLRREVTEPVIAPPVTLT